MQIVSRKNTILLLAAILVVLFSLVIVSSRRRIDRVSTSSRQTPPFERQLETQSTSDEVEDIETDLRNTDLTAIDVELQTIENELNQAY